MNKRDIRLIKEWIDTKYTEYSNYYCPWNVTNRVEGMKCKSICEKYFPKIKITLLCPCDRYDYRYIERKISKVIKEIEENA